MTDHTPSRLVRELGLPDSVLMGLGSIIGTGVFVSIGLAAGIAGPAMLISLALGALVGACNGLSSAQLAAQYPVSGGTYEYGYRTLKPALGFIAGWMFLSAKTASAATASLGFAGYLLNALGSPPGARLVPIALLGLLALTLVVLRGIRSSAQVNAIIVSVTLLSLLFFTVVGAPLAWARRAENYSPFFGTDSGSPIPNVLHAAALMFVAYTGYGRIATLGEEVREPRRTIPRAIIVTLILVMVLYGLVAAVGIGVAGTDVLERAAVEQAAPLEVVAREYPVPGARWVLAVGAITAMLGVLLNLVLGLSRVLLAMARRGDMPHRIARLTKDRTTPTVAVLVVSGLIAGITLIGNVRVTWSFSAFTVLIYYAITNLSAIFLPPQARLYPRWVSWLGLAGCLSLAFWVDRPIWLVGLGLIILGLIWHYVATRLAARAV